MTSNREGVVPPSKVAEDNVDEDAFDRRLSQVLGTGLMKYPVFERAERIPGPTLADYAQSQSDTSDRKEDIQIRQLAALFRIANQSQRGQIRNICRSSLSLIHFADRSATRALREGSSSDIEFGLMALVMEDAAFDYRETLVSLAKLRHAAARRNYGLAATVELISTLSTPTMARLLQGFFDRPVEGLLEAMGQVETRDANGPIVVFRQSVPTLRRK